MKEIRMDYVSYREELTEEFQSGRREDIREVLKWLESPMTLADYLGEIPCKQSYWFKIAQIIGRPVTKVNE